MDGDPKRSRVLVAQGLAALAYFFFVHASHAATTTQPTQLTPAPAHAAVVAIQPRRA